MRWWRNLGGITAEYVFGRTLTGRVDGMIALDRVSKSYDGGRTFAVREVTLRIAGGDSESGSHARWLPGPP